MPVLCCTDISAAVTAAEEQRAVIIMLRKESEIYALLKVYGLQQRVRRAALPCLFVFRHGGGEGRLHNGQEILQEADEQRVLILIARIYRAGGHVRLLRDLMKGGLFKAAGKKLIIGGADYPVIQRMVFVCQAVFPSNQ